MCDRIGVSSGKIISDVRDVSFGTVLSSFSAIKYEFLPLSVFFFEFIDFMRSGSRSSYCFVVNDSSVLKISFDFFLLFRNIKIALNI